MIMNFPKNQMLIVFTLILFLGLIAWCNATELMYSTFIGGMSGTGIAVDDQGNAYIVGRAIAYHDFPITPGAFDTSFNGGDSDAFISKLNRTGTALVYSTLLGGNGVDSATDIVVDAMGNAYIIGDTRSSNFPTTPGAFDTTYYTFYPGYDGFITKLSADGATLIYSTYLGGVIDDYANSIAIDSAGNAYITGVTNSVNFPITTGAVDTIFKYNNIFVSKLNPEGSALVYSTFIGAVNHGSSSGIAVDTSGNAYIAGYTDTTTTTFPTTQGAFDTSFNGHTDAFVTKLNSSGTALIYSTFIGGTASDVCNDIAIDQEGNAYITGYTGSSDFPTTPGTFKPNHSEEWEVFVTKLNPDGSNLVYSTFLGFGYSYAIVVDEYGNAIFTGFGSSDYPMTPDYLTYTSTYFDLFLTKLNATGSQLIFSTLFGGQDDDNGFDVAVDKVGNVYVTGETACSDFPTTSKAYDTTFNGFRSAYVFKVGLSPLNNYGGFSSSNDTTHWYFESYNDSTSPGSLIWSSSGSPGSIGVVMLKELPGEKGKLSQIFSVSTPGWYTLHARIRSTIFYQDLHPKVVLSLQEFDSNTTIIASANQVILPGTGRFGGSGAWKPLEISLYAQNTLLGIQFIVINSIDTSYTSYIYVDDLWVYPGVAVVTTEIGLSNSEFDEGTTGWYIEPYGDAWSAGIWEGWNGLLVGSQGPGEKGKISQLFELSTTEINVTGSVWVYSGATSINETQKVYLYLYSYDSGYGKVIESGNAILQPGKWVSSQWHQIQFGCLPLTTYNAVQLVAINPIGNPYQAIYFDDLEVKQE
jgi:hypothetical protein